MNSLTTIDHRAIYINPEPHRASEYVAFPYLAAQADDTLVCLCRHGTARESADGIVKVHRSTDGGLTWTCAGTICDNFAGAEGSQWGGGVAVMPDGELIAGLRICRQIGVDATLFLVRSRDGGLSWSAPEPVNVEPCGKLGGIGAITGLPDGTLLVTGEGKGDGDRVPEDRFANLLSRSFDGGRTWDPLEAINVSTNPYYFDLAVTQLADHRLLAAYWTHDMTTDDGLNVHLATSSDVGRTWTQPEDSGFWGQRTALLTLNDGRVLAVTNHRRKPLGIRVLVSDLDGTKFNEPNHLEIWGIEPAAVRTAPTLAAKQDTEEDALNAWHYFTFGAPAAAQCSDGTIVVAYYVTEESVTYLRCCRMKVGDLE